LNSLTLANNHEDKLGIFQAEFPLLLTGIIDVFTNLLVQMGKPSNLPVCLVQNVIMVLKIRVPLIRSVSYLQIHLGGHHEGEPR
jgi:hypothetical protein